MVVYPLLCGTKLGKDFDFNIFKYDGCKFKSNDKLTKVIMEAFITSGCLP